MVGVKLITSVSVVIVVSIELTLEGLSGDASRDKVCICTVFIDLDILHSGDTSFID
jgi:hypothetical protein